jgi:outer membrane immunogenic protein
MTTFRPIALFAAALSFAAPAAFAQDSWSSGQGVGVAHWQGPYAGAHVGAGFGKAGTQRTSGAAAGLTGGYNWQSDRFVAGVEADLTNSDIAAKSSSDIYRQRWLASLRGRAGVTFGNVLPFVTGGPAIAATEYRGNGSKDAWVTGWVAGAGAEVHMNRQFSLKGEILHYQMSNESYPVSTGTRRLDPTSNLIRMGANYRF